MKRIKNVSLFFRLILQILFVVLPLTMIISWIYAPEPISFFANIFQFSAIPKVYSGMHSYTIPGVHFLPTAKWVEDKAILHTLTTNEKISGCLVTAIPTLVNMFVLYCLICLFKRYEKGDIFSLSHVNYIRNIGYALLADQLIIQPLYQFVMGIVLTIHNPPPYRFASISFDQTNIGIILTALLIILISWIMAEAYQLREEQQLTI